MREGDPGVGDHVRNRQAFWWSPEVERLVGEGSMTQALELAWAGMEAVEHERPLPYGWAWGVTEIARRMRRYDIEVEVAERVLAIAGQGGTAAERWESRLAEAMRLASGASLFDSAAVARLKPEPTAGLEPATP